MPQFELQNAGPNGFSGLIRARTLEDAVHSLDGVPSDAVVRVEKTQDFEGWAHIHVNGTPMGRIRDHQRMRFRRD